MKLSLEIILSLGFMQDDTYKMHDNFYSYHTIYKLEHTHIGVTSENDFHFMFDPVYNLTNLLFRMSEEDIDVSRLSGYLIIE